ncbi:eukaryotic translation initiation factor 5B-like [Macadamia integrifolia]|uniref:eukaryotic translation initiation factor 5B-like n=1 Tax=Macadamia integrifolia TaxID=60698 RepID=UPI001C4EDF82|nr:eukaryotic translation initiation factor 5B-like [Macadamia integrifolia]XP_042503421.1 eukaryotic translation initiation factor 5B-like [Macadamia integrifolia]XP_042503422.1 eukaryotic translation initiation factor 5B-like [Macadamia integrifolia]
MAKKGKKDIVGEEENVATQDGTKPKKMGQVIPDDEWDNAKYENKEDDCDSNVITFSGKKKSSKSSKKGFSFFATARLDEEEGNDIYASEPQVETPIDESIVENEDAPTIKNKNATDAVVNKQCSKEVLEVSKNEKKRSGRPPWVEVELDKMIAELGEGSALSIPSPAYPCEVEVTPLEEVKVQVKLQEVFAFGSKGEGEEAEGEGSESAAAKKKRKKKEKVKARKVAATVDVKEKIQEQAKIKVSDNKVPKHVKEIREALERYREAEERMKREEEERSRKEEEELRQQEELMRQVEEARRMKKEREKNKLLKKKQEGKPVTGKQKEEARRLESMRNQFLAQADAGLPYEDTGGGPSKRPMYQTKKSKPAHALASLKAVAKEDHTTAGDVTEAEKVEKVKSSKLEVEQRVEANGIEYEGDHDEDTWDAKSWDDAAVTFPVKCTFAQEEVEPEPTVKNETKYARAPVSEDAAGPAVARRTAKSNNSKIESVMKKELTEAICNQSLDDLHSPICCVLGHVDAGKTKLLDCIRGTNIQVGEAGGITQQIGATYCPMERIQERTKELKADAKFRVVPGLLVIDTPGHEPFSNLRSRGSDLCDIAILVVDIMEGLKPQTIESLSLLKIRNTDFVVALNKVDRLYGWKSFPNEPIIESLKKQSNDVQNEFKMRLTRIITQFKEQGVNTELYYKNMDMGETVSIVPTSAISGEGIPDLLLLLVQWASETMVEKLMFSNKVQGTILEVKIVEGLGTTIDVVLINGILHERDQIVVCGMQGPIVTNIRALLTHHPMMEIQVQGEYLQHKELKATQGVKIAAQGLEHAIAGTCLYVVGPEDDLEDIKGAAMQEAAVQHMASFMSRGEGVCVQASTFGSLEALLAFLKNQKVNIPVSDVSIGHVHKRDIMRASVMLERKKEYATILAFDVKVSTEAHELAQKTGVKIFVADIIYDLFKQFRIYADSLQEEKKKAAAEEVVFPCVLKVLHIYNREPLLVGVEVIAGMAKVGTPLCIPSRDPIDIGRISSIEINRKPLLEAKKGEKVSLKITSYNSENQRKVFRRNSREIAELVSIINRRSIELLKEHFWEVVTSEDRKLLLMLKQLFKIR